jgi:NAD-dependent aldehyde dehydrogenases
MAKNSKVKKSDSIDWDYSVALESTDHISISQEYKLFIGGKFVKPLSKKYFNSINPSNEKILSKIASAGKADINKACISCEVSI